jgi:hypothetical protein
MLFVTFPSSPTPRLGGDVADNCLTALVDVNMLNSMAP